MLLAGVALVGATVLTGIIVQHNTTTPSARCGSSATPTRTTKGCSIAPRATEMSDGEGQLTAGYSFSEVAELRRERSRRLAGEGKP